MKIIFLLVFFPLLLSSFSFRDNNEVQVNALADTTTKRWIDDLKNFRDALYTNDTSRVKTFFKFPVLNPANEIWYLVLTGKELEKKKLTEKISPFAEKDLNKYYRKLFPKDFTKALLKIKSEQLYSKGETETPELKDTTGTIIKMYASVDKKENILTLNLSYNTPWKEDSGEVMDGGESNVLYYFRILKDQRLQFMYVRLAG